MITKYHLNQRVIIIHKILVVKLLSNDLSTPISDVFYLGRIAAMFNSDQLLIRRDKSKFSTTSEVVELQWINLATEDYFVLPFSLAKQCQLAVQQV